MRTIKMSISEYSKKKSLGYFTQLECITVFKKKVEKHNLGKPSEILIVDFRGY